MNPKLYILAGPPCTGKSTWARDYVLRNPNTVRINRDDLRLMLQGRPHLATPGEILVTEMVFTGIQVALEQGMNVIVDQTNCRLKYINEFIDRFNHLADIEFKQFEVDLETCRARNKQRAIDTGIVEIPDDILVNMHKNYEALKLIFDFKPRKRGTNESLV